jgi:hypothetical protein
MTDSIAAQVATDRVPGCRHAGGGQRLHGDGETVGQLQLAGLGTLAEVVKLTRL